MGTCIYCTKKGDGEGGLCRCVLDRTEDRKRMWANYEKTGEGITPESVKYAVDCLVGKSNVCKSNELDHLGEYMAEYDGRIFFDDRPIKRGYVVGAADRLRDKLGLPRVDEWGKPVSKSVSKSVSKPVSKPEPVSKKTANKTANSDSVSKSEKRKAYMRDLMRKKRAKQ